MYRIARSAVVMTVIMSGLSSTSSFSADGEKTSQMITDQPIDPIENVVITGSRTPADISELSNTVWVIDQKAINQQVLAGKDLKNALGQLIPGLDAGSQGRTNAGQNMRGRTMMVMIDGVSLNSSRGISRQLDAIDPFNIARIEVLGGASAVYGGGALGGVINIITKKGAQGLGGEVQGSIKTGFNQSDDRDYQTAVAIKGGNDRFTGRLAVAYQNNAAAYDSHGQPVRFDNAQTSLQFNDTVDVMASGQLTINESQDLTMMYQSYSSQSDGKHGVTFGPAYSEIPDPDLIQNSDKMRMDRQPGTDRQLLTVNYNHTAFLNQAFYLQGFYRNESLSFYPSIKGSVDMHNQKVPYFASSEQTTHAYGLKAVLTASIRDNWSVTYGIDVDRESFSANQMIFDPEQSYISENHHMKKDYVGSRYPAYDINRIAGFFQTEWQMTDRFSLNAGIRQDYISNDVHDFVSEKKQRALYLLSKSDQHFSAEAIPGGTTGYNVTLFNTGAVLKLTDSQQLWYNFSQAFDLPDIAKYYGIGEYAAAPDNAGIYRLVNSINVNETKLQGIKTNAYEFGWRITSKAINSQIALYYAQDNKSIRTNKKDYTIQVIDDKKITFGIEADLNYRLNQDWIMGATTNLLRSRTQNNRTKNWKKTSLIYASPSSATAYITWDPEGGNLTLQTQRLFSIQGNDNNKIYGYQTVDLIGSYRLPFGKLTLGINNLLNANYQTLWSQRSQIWYTYPPKRPKALFEYNGRGRTYTLGYTLDF